MNIKDFLKLIENCDSTTELVFIDENDHILEYNWFAEGVQTSELRIGFGDNSWKCYKSKKEYYTHSSIPFEFQSQSKNYYYDVLFHKDFGQIKINTKFKILEINYSGGIIFPFPHIRCVSDRGDEIVEKIEIICKLAK